MCIGNNQNAAPKIDFKDTILYGAIVRNDAGDVEHVLAYYNKVAALAAGNSTTSDFGWNVAPTAGDDFGWDLAPRPIKVGNALLFAVPAVPGSLTAKSLVPLKDFPKFMEDYKRAVVPPEPVSRSTSKSVSFSLGADSAPMVVKGFDGGLYDVVIAPGGASQIAQVIAQVDDDKRPALNEALYAELTILYPKFTFVLFCFAEDAAERAGCAMIRYTPQFPHLLYLPGLEGHNGKVERGLVTLNHTLVVGSHAMKKALAQPVRFSDAKLMSHAHMGVGPGQPGGMGLTAPWPKRPYYFLDHVIGKVIPDGTQVPQGDFLFEVSDIEKGIFRCRRQVPPGWKNLADKAADPAKSPFYITNA